MYPRAPLRVAACGAGRPQELIRCFISLSERVHWPPGGGVPPPGGGVVPGEVLGAPHWPVLASKTGPSAVI